jgi:hypothetical protein
MCAHWPTWLDVCVAWRGGLRTAEVVAAQPDVLMRRIMEHTHYYPAAWHGRLHTAEVHQQFAAMFPLRASVLVVEVLGLVLVPLTLAFGVAPCARDMIDFVRTCTVPAADARVGRICSFATFDLHRHGAKQVRIHTHAQLHTQIEYPHTAYTHGHVVLGDDTHAPLPLGADGVGCGCAVWRDAGGGGAAAVCEPARQAGALPDYFSCPQP